MMKDVKTLGDEEEEEVEDSTLDVMETQDEDVQGKEKKEDVVKLIETVVEEYFKDPKTENVEDENVKDSEAEKYGKKYGGRTSLMRPLLFCDRWEEKKQSKLWHEMTQDKSSRRKGNIVKICQSGRKC